MGNFTNRFLRCVSFNDYFYPINVPSFTLDKREQRKTYTGSCLSFILVFSFIIYFIGKLIVIAHGNQGFYYKREIIQGSFTETSHSYEPIFAVGI